MIISNVLLDGIGEVELVDSMGMDMRTVNAARSSYGKQKDERDAEGNPLPVDDKDTRLIAHLGRYHETSPLRHAMFTLRVKAPEFVARQWYKHNVGCAYAFKDLPWSEFSLRYSEVPPDMFVPPSVRAAHPTNKQATVERPQTGLDEETIKLYTAAAADAHDTYKYLMGKDCGSWPREQARGLLPMTVYTEWVWTCSLQAAVHFVSLREESKAQWEIQQYAKAVEQLCKPLAPESWAAVYDNHPVQLRRTIEALRAQLANWEGYIKALEASGIALPERVALDTPR
jgi:thymidylate synthase (FAD)